VKIFSALMTSITYPVPIFL